MAPDSHFDYLGFKPRIQRCSERNGNYKLSPDSFSQDFPIGHESEYEPLPQFSFYVPSWVTLTCSLALATGVSLGGLRILKTLGAKLYRMRPIHGFSAQGSAFLVIYLSSLIGYPVSTTQIVSSSIIGAGTAQSLSAVRWGVGRQFIHLADHDSWCCGFCRFARLPFWSFALAFRLPVSNNLK